MKDNQTNSQTGLYVGDKIRIDGAYGRIYVRRVEKFRDCLGVFLSESCRRSGDFSPLCNMYGHGAGSSAAYEPNHGEYVKDPVALWAQVHPDTPEEE